MKTLCLTADDLGIDPGVDAGILECLRGGLVRNVSIWIDALARPFGSDVLELLRGCCVGLHWPLFPPDLDLNRPADWARAAPLIWPVRREITTRLARLDAAREALERQGLVPAFINGHQHVHLLPAWVRPLGRWAQERGMRFMRLPAELGAGAWAARLRRPGLLLLEILGKLAARMTRHLPLRWIPAICRWSRELPLDELADALPGVAVPALEIVVHPGRPTPAYLDRTRVPIGFPAVMASLASPRLPRLLAGHGFASGRLDELV